jgi:hypothetical protein
MTYVLLKEYLYDLIDCIRPAVAIEQRKYTEKDNSMKRTRPITIVRLNNQICPAHNSILLLFGHPKEKKKRYDGHLERSANMEDAFLVVFASL